MIKQWLRNWLYSGDAINSATNSRLVCKSDEDVLVNMDNALRFSVLAANGGTVVQIMHYDRKTDRSNNITHIIPDNEPVAERIGQIVSMEIMRSS